MQNHDFHKHYRKLLEQDAQEAPDEVWNAISAAMDKDARPVEPDEADQVLLDEVWGHIEDELDVDEVWGTIAEELDEPKKRAVYGWLRYGVAAAIVLLLLGVGGSMHFFSARLTQPRVSKLHQYTEQGHKAPGQELHSATESADSLAEQQVVIVPDSPDEGVSAHAHTNKTYKATLQREEPDATARKQLCLNDEYNSIAYFPIPASGSFLVADGPRPLQRMAAFVELPEAIDLINAARIREDRLPNTHWIASFAPATSLTDGDELIPDRRDSKWTTGVITAVKNTYLLNQETLDGFSPAGMNNASLAFQPDVGLNVQYALSRRYILESNVFFSSTTRQDYQLYSYGEYVSKDMELNYLSTEFILKQNAKRSLLKDKLIRRNVAGVYVAHMQSASEQVKSELQDVTAKYAALDYGLMLGQELEIRSKGPVKVTTGITLKYGLPNVYAGDAQVPGQLNKTHNASIEFRVGIAYRWKAKAGIDHYLGALSKKWKK